MKYLFTTLLLVLMSCQLIGQVTSTATKTTLKIEVEGDSHSSYIYSFRVTNLDGEVTWWGYESLETTFVFQLPKKTLDIYYQVRKINRYENFTSNWNIVYFFPVAKL